MYGHERNRARVQAVLFLQQRLRDRNDLSIRLEPAAICGHLRSRVLPVVQRVSFTAASRAWLVQARARPLDQNLFLEAADLYRRARRAGFTVRSGVDCLIATCAIRNELVVLHQDRDYTALAQVSPLRQRPLGRARGL